MKKLAIFVLALGLVVGLTVGSASAVEYYWAYAGDQCKPYNASKADTMVQTAYGPRNADSSAQWWTCPVIDNWWGYYWTSTDYYYCEVSGWVPGAVSGDGPNMDLYFLMQNYDAGHAVGRSGSTYTYSGPYYNYDMGYTNSSGFSDFNDYGYRKVLWVLVPPGGYVYNYNCYGYN
jgi:hypothetical protein